MRYVDGFVIPIPKKSGEYRECIGDDFKIPGITPFPKRIKAKPGETSPLLGSSTSRRAHRDRVNAKVMKDPRMVMDPKSMPFDAKRMMMGGFNVIVEG